MTIHTAAYPLASRNGLDSLRLGAVGKPIIRRVPGECYFHEGDPYDGPLRLISGACRYVRYDRDGDRHILGFALPGELVGLPLRSYHGFGLEPTVETETVAVRIGDDNDHMNEALAEEVDRLTERAWLLASGQMMARFVSWLDRLMPRLHRDGDALVLPIPQVDIAAYLATTPETICRLMRQLREQKVIRQSAPQRLVVLDRDTLLRQAFGKSCALVA